MCDMLRRCGKGPWPARRMRGQSVVELALILPLLLVITMGTLDLGRLFFAYESLLNAAREGAFFAIYNPTWLTQDSQGSTTDSIVGAVQNQDSSLNIQSGDVSETCYSGVSSTTKDCSSAGTGDTVAVAVTYTFKPLTTTIINLGGLGSQIPLTATVRAGVHQ